MVVTAYPLSHSGIQSTAFLIQQQGLYLLYLGDTGPDKVEKSDRLVNLWADVAPLIQKQVLKAIIIEISFADPRPDKLLFGHLTPGWLIKEFKNLALIVNPDSPQTALQDVSIVINHIKPSTVQHISAQEQIATQLGQQNELNLKFLFAIQGERLLF